MYCEETDLYKTGQLKHSKIWTYSNQQLLSQIRVAEFRRALKLQDGRGEAVNLLDFTTLTASWRASHLCTISPPFSVLPQCVCIVCFVVILLRVFSISAYRSATINCKRDIWNLKFMATILTCRWDFTGCSWGLCFISVALLSMLFVHLSPLWLMDVWLGFLRLLFTAVLKNNL